MKLINTYEYRGRYNDILVTSKPESVYTLLSGVKHTSLDIDSSSTSSYGRVDDVKNMMSSHTMLIVVSPTSRDHTIIDTTMKLKRSYINNVLGFNVFNPSRQMWSLSLCKVSIEDITQAVFYSLLDKISMIDSNYCIISTNNNITWVKLTEVKDNIMLLPIVDNITLHNTSSVYLIDMFYQERSRLLDLRHSTTIDDKVNGIYNNN